MKIRISNNIIRFRLKQPEVEFFSEHRSITEVLDLGPTIKEQLRFRLGTIQGNEFSITYREETITIFIPQRLAEEWVSTDLVEIEEDISTSDGKIVRILVEKDFACLNKDAEENEGAYPNHKANC